MSKQYIPASVAVMMRTRGYKGEMPIGYYDAQRWALDKYSAWIIPRPYLLTPLSEKKDRLIWAVEARDVANSMDHYGHCEYFAINDEVNVPVVQELSDAQIKEFEVLYSSEKFYDTPEEAFIAGLIKTMKLLDE